MPTTWVYRKLTRDTWNSGIVRFVAPLLALAAAAATSPAAAGKDIGGRVTSTNREGVGGATVSIVSARPLPGQNATNPWCTADCGKHVVTDARGGFSLAGLHAGLMFELLIDARGFRPRTVVVNPYARLAAAEVILARATESAGPPTHKVLGRVVLPDGNPAVDAVVSIQMYQPPITIDQKIVTGPDGRFSLLSDQHTWRADVIVAAAGATQGKLFHLTPGEDENLLQLTRGSSLAGRVLWKTRPAAGVTVLAKSMQYRDLVVGKRLAVANAHELVPVTYQQVTDAEGRFVFEHIDAEADLRICTQMHSLLERNLAGIPQEVRAAAEGQRLDIGDLNLHPTHRLRGRLVVAVGDLPPRLRAVVQRRRLHDDRQEVDVDEQGYFEFQAVPSDTIELSFHSIGATFVRGYCLSPRNFSLERTLQASLCGQVSEDTDVCVLLKPCLGERLQPRVENQRANFEVAMQQRIEARPLFGVREESIREPDD